MLRLNGVTVGTGNQRAVQGLDLEVHEGEILGLIGPAGAGKTLLIDCITGRVRPTSGSIVLGRQTDLARLAPHQIARHGVSRTHHPLALSPGQSVVDNVNLGRRVKSRSGVLAAARCWRAAQREETRQRAVVDDIIEFLGLSAVRDTPVGILSNGLRKRVELARALAIEPLVLLLDEPTADMTVDEKQDIVRCIRRINQEMGVTLVFASRDLGATTEACDRVAVLDAGRKVAEGPCCQIRTDPRVIAALARDHLNTQDPQDLVTD